MLKTGIVGLPNVGKSSLFNALTAGGAAAENYPFCTVDPNVGIVEVPDPRLEVLHELTGAGKRVPTFIQFVDIAGLVQGASEGEGLGNQFLGQIREVDAVVHVLRCFEGSDVTHVVGSVDPLRDLEIVETELALSDLETLDRRREKVEKKARSGERDAQRELALMTPILSALSAGERVSVPPASGDEETLWREMGLLSTKPVLLVANVGEEEMGEKEGVHLKRLRDFTSGGPASRARDVMKISSAVEAELALLAPQERRLFLDEMGMGEGGLERLIRRVYELLGLITFFTYNEKEVRAWTLPAGETAPVAAGLIHSDFQRGFIRAETIGFEEFARMGSMKAAREEGLVRSEGKDYRVADGDIILFRFNV